MKYSIPKAFAGALPFIVLSVLTGVIYFNTLHNDFIFDDLPLIQSSRILPSLDNPRSIISVFTQKGGYRPIRTLSYAIDYRISGLNPVSYHISNIIYHTITAIFVYLVTLSIVSNRKSALFAAILFAVHPVHTDSVAYLAGSRDILSGLFFFMGFYCFLTYRKTNRLIFAPLTMIAYLLSIGSKEIGVTLPALFLVFDLVNQIPPVKKGLGPPLLSSLAGALKSTVKRYPYFYGFFLAGALTFSYYKVFINSPSHQYVYYGDSMWVTFLTVGRILVHYMQLLLFPVNLVADYSYNAFPLSVSLFEWSTLSSFLLLAGIGVFIIRMITRKKWIAFGGIWFFVTLLPVCHIIPHHELLAEHYLYIPSYGFFLIAATALTELLQGKRVVPLTLFIVASVIILFSVRTVDRNRDWKDSMTLWGKTVKTVPACARAQNNLGVEYLVAQQYTKAVEHLTAAIEIKPDYAEAYNNIGLVYKGKGLYDRAIDFFTKAIMLRKSYYDSVYNLANTFDNKGNYGQSIHLYNQLVKKKPNAATIYNNLGIAYQRKGQFELAREQYEKAVMLDPGDFEARNNLGVWYYSSGMYDKAAREFEQILEENPDRIEIRCNLGSAYSNLKLYDKAIAEYRKVLRANPRSVEAMNNLGTAYKDQGLYDQAIESFEQVLEINPQLAIPHLNLATVYLNKKKDPPKALYHFERAMEIEPDFPNIDSLRKTFEELKKEEPAT
jgi:tetratricopeptide (TPR) repeat protein